MNTDQAQTDDAIEVINRILSEIAADFAESRVNEQIFEAPVEEYVVAGRRRMILSSR